MRHVLRGVVARYELLQEKSDVPSERPKSVEVQSQGAEGESRPSSAPMVLPSQPAPLRFTAEPPEGLLAPVPRVSKRKRAVPMQYIQQGISLRRTAFHGRGEFIKQVKGKEAQVRRAVAG